MQSRSKGVEHDVYGRTEGQIQLRSLRRIGEDLAKLKLNFVFERETYKVPLFSFYNSIFTFLDFSDDIGIGIV